MNDLKKIIERILRKSLKELGFTSFLYLEDNIHLRLYGPDGKLKDSRDYHNQVQIDGKWDLMNQLLASPAKAKAAWMEVGTGTGQGTTSGTVLATYITGSRTACGTTTQATSPTNTVTYSCTFTATVGTGAITECGLFNVVTQNTADMWLYSSFSVINKGANDSLAVTWTLTAT